ncbi:unnamed protein product [Calypogeia fissa]
MPSLTAENINTQWESLKVIDAFNKLGRSGVWWFVVLEQFGFKTDKKDTTYSLSEALYSTFWKNKLAGRGEVFFPWPSPLLASNVDFLRAVVAAIVHSCLAAAAVVIPDQGAELARQCLHFMTQKWRHPTAKITSLPSEV